MCGIILIGGYVGKIEKYENNVLWKIEDNKSKLLLSNESYKKIQPKINKKFIYLIEDIKKSGEILYIQEREKFYEIILKTNNDARNMREIQYFLEKKNFWVNLFKY